MDSIVTITYRASGRSPIDVGPEASQFASENTPEGWELVGCNVYDKNLTFSGSVHELQEQLQGANS